MTKKTYIFLVSQYYPYCSAVGRCISNVVEHLAINGRVIIISTKQNDEEPQYESLSENITIIRMTSQYTLEINSLKKKAGEAGGLGRIKYSFVYCSKKIVHCIKDIVRPDSLDKRFVPDICDMLDAIIKSVCMENVVLLPTCTPFVFVYACAQYKLMNPRVCFIPYLFDEFSNNVSLCRGRLLKLIKYKRNIDIEKEVFAVADYVIHMPVWTKHIETVLTDYKVKCYQVEHPLLRIREVYSKQNTDNQIHVVYAGIVDSRIRNPRKALQISERLVERIDNLIVDYYSYGTAEKKIELSAIRSKGRIIAHGRVGGDIIDKRMRDADILLSIGNKSTDQIPSKIFEYMSYGHPIIHVSSSTNDRCEDVLANYPLSVVFRKNDDKNIENKISSVLSMIGKNVDNTIISSNYRKAIPKTTVDEINKLIQQFDTARVAMDEYEKRKE